MTVPDFILSLLAVSCAPPNSEGLEDEPLIRSTLQVCQALENTKRDLIRALELLRKDIGKGKNPKVQLARRRTSTQLTKALRQRNLTQTWVAQQIGVTTSAFSQVVTGRKSLPPAWGPVLLRVLGDDWMSE